MGNVVAIAKIFMISIVLSLQLLLISHVFFPFLQVQPLFSGDGRYFSKDAVQVIQNIIHLPYIFSNPILQFVYCFDSSYCRLHFRYRSSLSIVFSLGPSFFNRLGFHQLNRIPLLLLVTDHNKNGCCQSSKTCLGWTKQSHVQSCCICCHP